LKNSLNAHAKINLHLDVGPRRKDGYHSLVTLFQEISLHDTLEFELTPARLSLSVSNNKLSTGPDNLILRALHMLRQELGETRGLRVRLTKRIPMGAGLGGGSSDAAAALWAGWVAWKNRPLKEAIERRRIPPILKRCAPKLGADVAFFLQGGRAWGRGIGEQLKAVRRYKKDFYVLIYPRVHVATAKAYAWLDESREVGLKLRGLKEGENSFEEVVLPRFPEIKLAHQELKLRGASPVLMSGSGASVYGVVADESAARRIQRALSKKRWDVYAVRSV
jgi:4-diphosphocytidyl-2-C-methyl-D-erythritol kinase